MNFRERRNSSTAGGVSEARALARDFVTAAYRDSPGRAALPPDVRKAFGLPAGCLFSSEAPPRCPRGVTSPVFRSKLFR